MKFMFKKMIAILIATTMVFSSSVAIYANNVKDNDCEINEGSSEDITSSSRFEKYVAFIENFEGAEIDESEKEIVQEDEASEYCEELIDESDTTEEIDEEVFEETDEEETTPGKYILLTTDNGITVINNDTNEYTSVAINKDGNVDVEMVELNQNNDLIRNTTTVDILEDDVIEGQGWKSVVKETYKNKYWYQNSDTGKYVRIGCDARYKINYNSLSNSKADNVRTYRAKVKATKTKWAAYKSACNKAGLSGTAVVAALVAAFGAAPETFGTSLLVGTVVGLAAGVTWNEGEKIVKNFKGTKKAYKKVKSTYTTIKKYGAKY